MKISFDKSSMPKSGVLLVLAEESADLLGQVKRLDDASKGRLSHALKAGGFTGKKDQIIDVLAPFEGLDRIILMGVGLVANLIPREIELLGGAILGTLQGVKAKAAVVDACVLGKGHAAALLASGAKLRRYSFELYKTKKDKKDVGPETLAIQSLEPMRAKKAFIALEAVAAGNHVARDLVNEPANILYPIEFASRAKALTKLGVKIEILNPAQMKKLGMGALLGVGLGSPHEARLVVMRWEGGKKGDQPIAFVGKGVTFDTGGVSIKPAAGMEDMKGDMAGAACVVGLMHALAKRKAQVNVIGAIGLVENAVDGKAQRPGGQIHVGPNHCGSQHGC
jgi:leucyl aminopeptidase